MDFTVAHVLPFISDGGLWRHLAVAERLSAQGIDSVAIELFALEGHQACGPLRMPVARLGLAPREYKNIPWIVSLLEAELRRRRVSLVHSYHLFSDVYAIPAAAEVGLPVFRTIAGITQANWSSPFDRSATRTDWSADEIAMELALEDRVHLTLVVSAEARSRICGYGFDRRKVLVSYLGTDTPPPHRSCLLRRQNDAGRSLVVGFMHRLDPVKLSSAFVPALARIVSTGIDVLVVLVRGGTLEEGFLAALRTAGVRSISVPRSHNFWEEIPPLDCFLVVSQSEGVPLTLLEAMARCVPPIAARSGGIPEVVRDGVTGWLIDADDATAIESALRRVLARPNEKARIARAARRHVRLNFNSAAHVRDLERHYRAALHARRR